MMTLFITAEKCLLAFLWGGTCSPISWWGDGGQVRHRVMDNGDWISLEVTLVNNGVFQQGRVSLYEYCIYLQCCPFYCYKQVMSRQVVITNKAILNKAIISKVIIINVITCKIIINKVIISKVIISKYCRSALLIVIASPLQLWS